ncbi:MAG: hypothetical protein R3C46_11270 [Hyphomonadaceae bacterium]
MNTIDVWDVATFDPELHQVLDGKADLVRNYVTRDKANFLAYDYADRPVGLIRPDNPFAADFIAFKDGLSVLMQARTIRAWHYTRMTDGEVASLRQDGIHLSTPDTLRERLDRLVADGVTTAALADDLIRHSPFQSDQLPYRRDRFWLVSHPRLVTDSGVKRLLAYWGGEVASFHTDDPSLLHPLSLIGRPRVLEVATPLEITKHAFSAAGACIAAYARTLGCVESSHGFDVCITANLAPTAVIRVHSEGEPSFKLIGQGHPERYVDVDRDYWTTLTGERD